MYRTFWCRNQGIIDPDIIKYQSLPSSKETFYIEDADQGKVERPIATPALTQLKNARANAKRQVTRLVNRVDDAIKRREGYEEIQEEESLLITLLGLATEAHHDYVSSLDLDS